MRGVTAGGASSAQSDPQHPGLDEDELFDVLANRRRRYALHAISRDPETYDDLGTLSEQVAAWENDVAVPEVSYTERKRAYTALQQSHLPRMDEAGLVEFDKDRGLVHPTPDLDEVDIYLDVVRGRELPWSEYYLALSGVSAALLAAVWMDAMIVRLLPDLAWFAFVVVAFFVSAVANRYFSRGMRLGERDEPPELVE